MIKTNNDTIAAIATPPGRGGVGIVRISGPQVVAIAQRLIGAVPTPRYAHYGKFLAADNTTIDAGIVLYFPAPHSFTGEEVLELQGHGGPVVMNLLLERVVSLGARLARPGEFSERAFLNDKIDLIQAEAIADLIDAASTQAAHNAINTLQGEFSKQIDDLVRALIQLRVYVEAALDFPEEEVDFLADNAITEQLNLLLKRLDQLLQSAKQGVILREGMRVVIAGKPNVGKSSLLNRLTGRDTAIVTDLAGTTRDVLRELIQLDGIPLHLIDTAGLHDSQDRVEKEGIKRARQEISQADVVLLIVDAREHTLDFDLTLLPQNIPLIIVKNKADLLDQAAAISIDEQGQAQIFLSAKTGAGIDLLTHQLKTTLGYQPSTEGNFMARQRHVDALKRANDHLFQGLSNRGAGELLATDLRHAQQALAKISGEFTADDLLGEIFSSFCIGK